jgi:FkbM family methyltransferase
VIDVAFFYVDFGSAGYREMIQNMIESARMHIPEVRIVQLTDSLSPRADDIDRLCRIGRPVNRSELAIGRVCAESQYMSVASDQISRNVVFVDPDIIFLRDVTDVFDGSFDAGITWRKQWKAMPYNAGLKFAAPDSKPFWNRCEAIVGGMPSAIWGWWGDQIVLSAVLGVQHVPGDIVNVDGARVKILDQNKYAPTAGDARGNPYALHLKGSGAGNLKKSTPIGKHPPWVREHNGFVVPAGDSGASAVCFSELSGASEHVFPLVKNRGVVVQAGGNFGSWPKYFSQHFDRVYTFEPDMTNFYCLSVNVSEQNVFKFNAALGAEHGTVGLAGTPANCGSIFVSGAGDVPTLKIDDLGLGRCDLIYLDVEGAETVALHGAFNTIDKYRPVVAVESKGRHTRFDLGAPEDYLAKMGYRVHSRIANDTIMVSE